MEKGMGAGNASLCTGFEWLFIHQGMPQAANPTERELNVPLYIVGEERRGMKMEA
jgi:hypothetical protein